MRVASFPLFWLGIRDPASFRRRDGRAVCARARREDHVIVDVCDVTHEVTTAFNGMRTMTSVTRLSRHRNIYSMVIAVTREGEVSARNIHGQLRQCVDRHEEPMTATSEDLISACAASNF